MNKFRHKFSTFCIQNRLNEVEFNLFHKRCSQSRLLDCKTLRRIGTIVCQQRNQFSLPVIGNRHYGSFRNNEKTLCG